MSGTTASVSCSIEVYPFEGGPFTIQGGQIKSVTYDKNIRGGAVGNATIELAPGGPFGTESSPTWAQVLTPMSHVLIGMTRGSRSAIVFDGVVTRTEEQQEWHTTERGSFAIRTIVVTCADFAWFFRTFNWFALTFLGLTQGAAFELAYPNAPPGTGVAAVLSQGLLGDANPAVIASRWYELIMTGEGTGILGKTFTNYKNNARITFQKMVRTIWEAFPDAKIPVGDFYMAVEGTWMDKFLSLLPMPWYEFFVTTAPTNAYGVPNAKGNSSAQGTVFGMISQPLAAPAGPVLVARINPIPVLGATATAVQVAPKFTSLDMSRWNALLLNDFTSSPFGFIASDIAFDADGATNFYQLNPTGLNLIYNKNDSNNIPFYFSMMGASDPASIHRYGYRPNIGTFRWLYDPQGTAAKNPDIDYPTTVAILLARQVSWAHPLPLMARASAALPLTPDILIGTRFRYAPFKDGTPWDFYVETVRHRFMFGGQSETLLGLSRGLPSAVYADSSDGGIMRNVYLGNAQRVNGDYAVGLPNGTGPGLTPFGTPESTVQAMGQMAKIFVTPQPPAQ